MSTMTTKKSSVDFRSRFGFHATPFTREFPADHRFRLPHFDDALEALLETVDQRGSAALIAAAGMGKTQLLRALRALLPEARYDVHYIKTTTLSRRDMCRAIASAMGCKPAGSLPALVRRLDERFLASVDNEAVRPVLILDDAHEMRVSALGLLKVLTNFDMDSRLVVSIILTGQPQLRTILRRTELEDVARRLVHYAELRLLSRNEMRGYVEHRCAMAGSAQVPFDEAALDALFELSRGNLRAIDLLCLKALQLASKADREVVEAPHLVQARKLLWP